MVLKNLVSNISEVCAVGWVGCVRKCIIWWNGDVKKVIEDMKAELVRYLSVKNYPGIFWDSLLLNTRKCEC